MGMPIYTEPLRLYTPIEGLDQSGPLLAKLKHQEVDPRLREKLAGFGYETNVVFAPRELPLDLQVALYYPETDRLFTEEEGAIVMPHHLRQGQSAVKLMPIGALIEEMDARYMFAPLDNPDIPEDGPYVVVVDVERGNSTGKHLVVKTHHSTLRPYVFNETPPVLTTETDLEGHLEELGTMFTLPLNKQ